MKRAMSILGMSAMVLAVAAPSFLQSARAQEAGTQAPAVNAPQKKAQVLDFEADVIEGQKKAPELFLQLDVQKPDLSSVLYDRKHFNDFHAIESKRRPRLSTPPKTQ